MRKPSLKELANEKFDTDTPGHRELFGKRRKNYKTRIKGYVAAVILAALAVRTFMLEAQDKKSLLLFTGVVVVTLCLDAVFDLSKE